MTQVTTECPICHTDMTIDIDITEDSEGSADVINGINNFYSLNDYTLDADSDTHKSCVDQLETPLPATPEHNYLQENPVLTLLLDKAWNKALTEYQFAPGDRYDTDPRV